MKDIDTNEWISLNDLREGNVVNINHTRFRIVKAPKVPEQVGALLENFWCDLPGSNAFVQVSSGHAEVWGDRDTHVVLKRLKRKLNEFSGRLSHAFRKFDADCSQVRECTGRNQRAEFHRHSN